jgi:hypothetical protein
VRVLESARFLIENALNSNTLTRRLRRLPLPQAVEGIEF